jgi:hypothetical protein
MAFLRNPHALQGDLEILGAVVEQAKVVCFEITAKLLFESPNKLLVVCKPSTLPNFSKAFAKSLPVRQERLRDIGLLLKWFEYRQDPKF